LRLANWSPDGSQVEVEADAPREEVEALREVLAEFGIEGAVEPSRLHLAAVEIVALAIIITPAYKSLRLYDPVLRMAAAHASPRWPISQSGRSARGSKANTHHPSSQTG